MTGTMDHSRTFKSPNQKNRSIIKRQTALKQNHLKTGSFLDEQNSNSNSVSGGVDLSNLDGYLMNKNKMDLRSASRQSILEKQPLYNKQNYNQNSISKNFSRLSINEPHLSRNLTERRSKLQKSNIEKHNTIRSLSQDNFHSGQVNNIPKSNIKEFGYRGGRHKQAGSQHSSRRSSVSSLLSNADTDLSIDLEIDPDFNRRNNKLLCNSLSQNGFLSNKFHNKPNANRKEFNFKGGPRIRLQSQCSSTHSSVSSLLSCDDFTCESNELEKGLEKRNSHYDLSNNFLKSWIRKNDDSLVFVIIKNKHGFKNLFCNFRRVNDMIIVLELLNRICEINDPVSKEYFLSFSLNQQFFENIDNYLSCILLSSSKGMLKNLEELIKYYSEIINFVPSEILDDFYELLTNSLNKIEKISNIPDFMIDNIKEIITNTSEKLENIKTRFDVSSLSILPSPDDIDEIPELQSNIITGPYENPSHYLNLHFKLLKEDFVCNLRSGLKQYIDNINSKESKSSRIKDIFVYDAIYCGLQKNSRKTNLSISFEIDNKKLKKVDWSTSKRLIHGSLLLVSNDNFKTYYLTFFDDKRTPRNEDNFFLISALVVNKLIKFKKYSKCTIIEPRVFFNPYFQVLKTIKKIEPIFFPMERYIVQVDTEINPPIYLNNGTNYSISGNEVNPFKITSYEFREIFSLNESQISALQAALTKEFVIIQGPPGTGKSHLGLRIINILLNNSSAWKKDKSPILVICYRNNAVDQILESLIKDGRNIVRLGSQSNCDAVKECCLRNAVKTINSNPVIRDQINTLKNQIEILRSQIVELQAVIDFIKDKKGVLSLASFSEVLSENQKYYLSKSNVFEEWLFGGSDMCDSNQEFLDDLLSNRSKYSSSINQPHNSFLLISIPGLVNELSDLDGRIEDIYCNDFPIKGQDALSEVVQILLEYGEKELFLNKILNRMNSDIDNFIDITTLGANDLFKLSIPERWKLYKHWADEFCKKCLEKIDDCFSEINEKLNALDELNDMNDGFRVLQLCPDAVGATTTGAARMHTLLSVIKPKIVVFEEAAEVLEIHTITALTKYCEHVIMIGDHQQLPPNPASHISAIKHKLDVSLFERMIKNGIEYFTLNEQHRMRPLISSLVIPQFYPNLLNHAGVEKYPDVRGVRDNMFFLDHTIPEDELTDSESHRNKYEANLALALADYMLKQGYSKKDITILTLYGAQLLYLFAVRSKYPSLKGVQVEVVDNYQGEENKIIILSLVRSNPFSIGFLSKMNRICVALTRAKEGFYLIGNMTCLQGNSSVWKGINETLQRNKVIGNELPLKCSTHGTVTYVRTTEDFLPLVFGGCTQICGMRLECGHICEFQCHGSDECHLDTFSCKKPCQRKSGCNIHDCRAECGIPCPKCVVIVETVLPCGHPGLKECEGGSLPCSSKCSDMLSCGHPCLKECHYPMPHLSELCSMPCGKPNILCPMGHKCQKQCGEECGECVVKTITTLPCGHVVNGECCKIKNLKCEVLVTKELDCGHTVEVECFKSASEVECNKTTLEQLPCGHNIEVPCGRTSEGLICQENVEKCLPCGHSKTIPCHSSSEENFICEELVKKELNCGHGSQMEKCSTPPEDILCKKKVIKTVKECGHKVKVMCYMKSSKAVCKQPCTLIKPCGHQCSGLCGQVCPECTEMIEIDQVCGHKGFSPCADNNTKALDPEMETNFGSLKCETPCDSILKCGHQCEGTCGKCMQGCIHEACVATCGSLLLCGHKCSNDCSSSIHLCVEKCLNKCKHKTCKNKCGEPCQKCKEKCDWQCEHFRCTKPCWEKCNRPPCEAPCTKLLLCGHTCNGFCGEPCPEVCIYCNPVYNQKSKFILLEDCGHFISKTEFSTLMSQTIGLFLCPSCQKPQTSSNYIRYYTKQFFFILSKIKKKMYNKFNNVRSLMFDINSSLLPIHNILQFNFNNLEDLNSLLKSIVESVKTMVLKKNERTCIEILRSSLFVSYYINEAFHKLKQTNQANDLNHLLRLNYLASYLRKWETGISRDQMYQLKNELFRLLVIFKLTEIKGKGNIQNDPFKMEQLEKAMESACAIKEFDDDKQKNIVSLIKPISSNFEINSNLLSDDFLTIFKKYYSLTLHKESWVKCNKNGHLFYCYEKNISELPCPTCTDSKREFLF